MNEYLRKYNGAESFGLNLFYFAFIYGIRLFYCNPYTGTDEIFAYEYYWQLNSYCRYFDDMHSVISSEFGSLTWTQLFIYSFLVLGASFLTESISNLFRNKTDESIFEPNSNSDMSLVIFELIFYRVIQIPLIMWLLAGLNA